VAGQFVSGLSTFFSAIGTPFSGCGVPPSKLVDESGKPLPWVALNTNGPFSGGKNCGRFVQIKLGKNCAGGSNSGNSVCNGGSAFSLLKIHFFQALALHSICCHVQHKMRFKLDTVMEHLKWTERSE
jgi:hypothetical protein